MSQNDASRIAAAQLTDQWHANLSAYIKSLEARIEDLRANIKTVYLEGYADGHGHSDPPADIDQIKRAWRNSWAARDAPADNIDFSDDPRLRALGELYAIAKAKGAT